MTRERALELAMGTRTNAFGQHATSAIADVILAAIEEETSSPGEFAYSEETKAKAREMFEAIQAGFKAATGRFYKHGQSDAEDRLYADMFIPLRAMLRRAQRLGPSDRHGFVGGPFAMTCELCRNGKYTPIHDLNP